MKMTLHMIILISAIHGWEGGELLCSFDDLQPKLEESMLRMKNSQPIFPTGPTLQDYTVVEAMQRQNPSDLPILDWRKQNDRELAARLISEMIPFVVQNSAAVEKMQTLWTESYMKTNYTHRRVVAREYLDHFEFAAPPFKISFQVPERACEPRERLYLISVNHTTQERTIATAAFNNPYLQPKGYVLNRAVDFRVRFGYDDMQILPHYDSQPGFLSQIENKKRFLLFHPLQERHLPWERNPESPHHSSVRSSPRETPNDFINARAIAHVLNPGELMHIPALWWHYVDFGEEEKCTGFWSTVTQPWCYKGYQRAPDHVESKPTFPRGYGLQSKIYPCGMSSSAAQP